MVPGSYGRIGFVMKIKWIEISRPSYTNGLAELEALSAEGDLSELFKFLLHRGDGRHGEWTLYRREVSSVNGLPGCTSTRRT